MQEYGWVSGFVGDYQYDIPITINPGKEGLRTKERLNHSCNVTFKS